MTDGHGLVQTSHGQTIAMRPGDTVFTPPGVWHWHGATPDCFMRSHLALADRGCDLDAADVEWGEFVGDDEYHAAHDDTDTGRDVEESIMTAAGTRPPGSRFGDDRLAREAGFRYDRRT